MITKQGAKPGGAIKQNIRFSRTGYFFFNQNLNLNIRERHRSTVSYIVLQIYAPFPDYQTYLRCSITVYLLVRLLVYVGYNLNGLLFAKTL